MRRRKLNLRGSVRQQSVPVRLRAREVTRFGILLRFSMLAGLIVLIIGVCWWSWANGWPQKQFDRLTDAALHATQKAHFAVGDVQVQGRYQTSKDSLFTALGLTSGAPILAFDPEVAQARVAKLPWVAAVTIERRLPDTIVVRLTERLPLARWQHDGRVVVIDAEGKELPGADLDQFGQLPLVVGTGAPFDAKRLLDSLKEFPAVAQKMTAAVRVSDRRWDIHLQPKVTARMPEVDLPTAIKRLSGLITEQKLLDHDITVIDLRLPDRVVIEPAAAATMRPSGDQHL